VKSTAQIFRSNILTLQVEQTMVISVLENDFKFFMQSQTKNNNILMKITENQDNLTKKLSNQAITLKKDVKAI
jgi:hypothetical protein